jgi:hypothetical protein
MLNFLLLVTIVANYFDVYYHFWFCQCVRGIVFKIWVLPFLLFLIIIIKKIVKKLRTGSFTLKMNGIKPILFFLAFYVVFGVVSLFRHESIYLVGKYSLIMFAPLFLYLSIIELLVCNEDIEKLIKILFIVGVIFSLYVVYKFDVVKSQAWFDDKITVNYIFSSQTHMERRAQESISLESIGKGHFIPRKTLIGVDSPAFAAMLAPLILIGIFYSSRANKIALRYFYGGGAVLLYYVHLGTLSRSSFVGFIGGLFLFLWYGWRGKVLSKKHIALVLFIVVVGVAMTNALQYRLLKLVGSVLEQSNVSVKVSSAPSVSTASSAPSVSSAPSAPSVSSAPSASPQQALINKIHEKVWVGQDGHVNSIRESMRNFLKNPWFGIGISYNERIYKGEKRELNLAEHNRYLYLLVTSGLFTAVAYVCAILAMIFCSWRMLITKLRRGVLHNDIGLVLFASLVLFAIQIINCCMERYYYWVFFGFATAWIRNSKRDEECKCPVMPLDEKTQ